MNAQIAALQDPRELPGQTQANHRPSETRNRKTERFAYYNFEKELSSKNSLFPAEHSEDLDYSGAPLDLYRLLARE